MRIVSNLKELDYSQFLVNLLKDEAHLVCNPQGLVPVFEDQGITFNQSLAVCKYLNEAYPDTAQLLPDNMLEKAHVRGLAQLIAYDIHPVNNLRILKYLVSKFGVTEEQKIAWYQHWIHEGFKY